MKEEIFSPMENKILTILGKRKMSIKEITEKYLVKGESTSLNPQQVIAGAIKNINKKCTYHTLKWNLNSYGRGRGGKVVWRDKI